MGHQSDPGVVFIEDECWRDWTSALWLCRVWYGAQGAYSFFWSAFGSPLMILFRIPRNDLCSHTYIHVHSRTIHPFFLSFMTNPHVHYIGCCTEDERSSWWQPQFSPVSFVAPGSNIGLWNSSSGPSYSSFCSMLSSDRLHMSSKLTELLFINVANSFRQQVFAVPLWFSNMYQNRIWYRLWNIKQVIHICASTINWLTDSQAPWMAKQCYR